MLHCLELNLRRSLLWGEASNIIKEVTREAERGQQEVGVYKYGLNPNNPNYPTHIIKVELGYVKIHGLGWAKKTFF